MFLIYVCGVYVRGFTAPGTFSRIACRKRDARAAVVPDFYAWAHLQDPGAVSVEW
jgi:hypothetical protein